MGEENSLIPDTLIDKILSTPARRKLYQARMEGKNIREAAEIAGIGYNYARDICAGIARRCATQTGINAIVKAEQAKIQAKAAEKLEITAERQIREYEVIKDKAIAAGDYSAARMALDSQSRIIGAFEADNSQKQFTFAMPGLKVSDGVRKQIDSEIVGNQPRLLDDSLTRSKTVLTGEIEPKPEEAPPESGEKQG